MNKLEMVHALRDTKGLKKPEAEKLVTLFFNKEPRGKPSRLWLAFRYAQAGYSRGTNSFKRRKRRGIKPELRNKRAETLAKGDHVEIRGFCSFFVKEYGSYIGLDPIIGEKIKIKSKKLPFLKPGKELKDRVDR